MVHVQGSKGERKKSESNVSQCRRTLHLTRPSVTHNTQYTLLDFGASRLVSYLAAIRYAQNMRHTMQTFIHASLPMSFLAPTVFPCGSGCASPRYIPIGAPPGGGTPSHAGALGYELCSLSVRACVTREPIDQECVQNVLCAFLSCVRLLVSGVRTPYSGVLTSVRTCQ